MILVAPRSAKLVHKNGGQSGAPIPMAGGEVLPPGPPMAGDQGEAMLAPEPGPAPGGEAQ